ncbi:MAG TPA: DUF5343 domain-containing protein [Candidatus Didemnitutus sp.]
MAFKTFTNFIDGLREAGLPGRIDKSVMDGQSGGTQSSLLLTLKYLGLITPDGTPTPALVALVKPAADRKKIYAEIVHQHYAFVAAKGARLETATEGQLDEVFRESLSGDTVRKAMTFYVLLATEAGLAVSPHLRSAKRKSTGTGGSTARRPRKKNTPASQPPFSPPPPVQNEPEGHKTYTLDLTADGKRLIRITAPFPMTRAEADRVTGWIDFQFNVTPKKN